ncbi:DUF6732 family protein [Roseovarius salinarum]|jgi:hypothetical protein|uniref:DUF6732 family protein n=1 Tax=Roseovarius salinarum TaxID=1981892 RepID=UPI000C336CBE|nr:DUF6732 family protein [Roseovarius salinarum]
MKKLTICLILPAGAAGAHPGHVAESAGHGHWLGLAAIGAAIALGLWAGLRARRRSARTDAQTRDADEDTAKET